MGGVARFFAEESVPGSPPPPIRRRWRVAGVRAARAGLKAERHILPLFEAAEALGPRFFAAQQSNGCWAALCVFVESARPLRDAFWARLHGR